MPQRILLCSFDNVTGDHKIITFYNETLKFPPKLAFDTNSYHCGFYFMAHSPIFASVLKTVSKQSIVKKQNGDPDVAHQDLTVAG